MTHFKSKNWRIFTSRPTSILKRDFAKWPYLSIRKIKGFKLTKLLAIGNNQEMDVFIDSAEDRKNHSKITEQFEREEVEKILKFYDHKISLYKPKEKGEIKQSLQAMKDVGSIIIYTYYVERLLGNNRNVTDLEILLKLNSRVRDSGAKIIYPLYDKARVVLADKYKNTEVDWLTLGELARPPVKTALKQRKKFYVFLGTAKGSSIYTGKAAKQFLEKEKFTEIKNNVSKNEVNGLPAGGGSVIGKVKIVRGMKDMENCVGKIIVSRDTVIEYTPMLKNNLAIVTDFGGISCHAAVTAREFKIPCVVGTKIATGVFKDNDLVEVDAGKGMVKIIKRAEK